MKKTLIHTWQNAESPGSELEAAARTAATYAEWTADAAARAADAAAAAAYAAAAADWAADAADTAAEWTAERKRQADFIRTIVLNPFQP